MQAWRVYNRSALDFNLFFCSRTAAALESALPCDERAVLPLIWRAGVDDWDAYLRSHFRHIQWHYFKQAACAPVLKDYGLEGHLKTVPIKAQDGSSSNLTRKVQSVSFGRNPS